MAIPIIDIFAGPGGLGEGFCSLADESGKSMFKIALSIEKDSYAHQTLTLRSFFRQFDFGKVPDDYYQFVQDKITIEELYKRWPEQSKKAKEEAWLAELGKGESATESSKIDKRISAALKGSEHWLLIGGPPCQAYSVVGRVRRKQNVLDESTDERVGLYKQYLRILAIHSPSVFVMENVKGLLSATTDESPVFTKILKDLANPVIAYLNDFKDNGHILKCPGYKIYSLILKPTKFDANGNPVYLQKDFLIRSEKYGIPQTRHRVILLGIRNDIQAIPGVLKEKDEVSIREVLTGLPRLRSKLSKAVDDDNNWKDAIKKILKKGILSGIDEKVKVEIQNQIQKITIPHQKTGSEYISSSNITVDYKKKWFLDDRLAGISNHAARGHMESDLHRYFFISCFANINGHSPQLADFPPSLLPAHRNVYGKDGDVTRKFADRFRVQLKNKPSKTVTSHISQDGHYFIHFDPTQCRSLTVREAARVQTFPDNYHFCGPRTSQFIQVGNAVPPLLANSIAHVVRGVFDSVTTIKSKEQVLAK